MGTTRRIKRRQEKELKGKRQTVAQPRARLGPVFAVLCLLLVIATLAVYWQVSRFPLINCDDRDYVTNNALVKAGLTKEGFLWAFNIGYAGNWHPLTWLSHMLDSQFFGSQVPTGPGAGARHVTSLMLHVANTVLLFLVLALITGYVWRSAFVAALFALHPLHVESVAWVVERKDVLSTFFMMLTLWGYYWYVRKPSVVRYVPIVLAFALGLMAKPMLVTLPVLMLILDFWPLKRFDKKRAGGSWALLWEKIPLFALTAVSCKLTYDAQQAVGAVSSFKSLTLAERIPNAMMSCVIYVVKMFWPSKLGSYYTYPRDGWPPLEVAGAALLLVGMTYLCIRTIRTRPYLITGWLWYLVTLLPVIGLLQVGSQSRADRYTYIPLIGIFIIIAYGVPDLVTRLRRDDAARPSPWPARIAGAVAVVVIGVLGAATYVQTGYWRDGITVARRAIAVTENNWFEEQSLGSQLQDEAERLAGLGQLEEGRKIAREAARHLKESLAHAPEYADAHNDYGRALATLGNLPAAALEYQRVIRINPRHALAHNNLGNTYLGMGRNDDAIDQYRQTLMIDRRNVFATYNMGIAFQMRGDYDAAIQQYLQVLRLQPNTYFAYWARYNAAVFYKRKGNLDEASQLLHEAIRVNEATPIDPDNRAAGLLGTILRGETP